MKKLTFINIGPYNVINYRETMSLGTQIMECDPPITGILTSLNFEKIVTKKEPLPDEYFIIDGIYASLFALKHGIRLHRNPGVDLFHVMLEKSALDQVSIYFLGAKPDVHRAVIRKFNDLGGKSTGRHGYQLDIDQIADDLKSERPRYVFVALGSPLQERVCQELYCRYPNALFVGVGGSFDIYAGALRRCPKLLRMLGLEWFYRIMRQPVRLKRLIGRVYGALISNKID